MRFAVECIDLLHRVLSECVNLCLDGLELTLQGSFDFALAAFAALHDMVKEHRHALTDLCEVLWNELNAFTCDHHWYLVRLGIEILEWLHLREMVLGVR
jgi:hypothetical protein